jgi:hypothetical protein
MGNNIFRIWNLVYTGLNPISSQLILTRPSNTFCVKSEYLLHSYMKISCEVSIPFVQLGI